MSIAAFFRQRRLPALVLFLASVAAQAQIPVAAPSTDPAVRLAANMRDLARNPNSIEALKGAGESALAVGDTEAAFNFLSRAQELSPADGRIKALLGSALMQMERPSDALQLFAEAETLGVDERLILKDRGLAYDLRGDQKRAQRDYQQFLRINQDDEVTRRLALSYGISGDRERALQLLDPLLKQRDQSAWRARTFILAMNGAMREADDIAAQVMPSDGGASMRPFLRQLAMLTPSQRALAVNFGIMPADGGRGASAYAQVSPEPLTTAGQLKEPEGRLSRKGRSDRSSREAEEEEQPSWAASPRDRKRNREVAMASLPTPRAPDADGPRPDFRIDAPTPVVATPVLTPAPSRPLVRAPLPATPTAPRVATVNLPPVRTTAPAVALPPPPATASPAPMGSRIGNRIGPVDAARVSPDIRPLLPSATTASKPGDAPATTEAQPGLKVVQTDLTRLPPPDSAQPIAPSVARDSGRVPVSVAAENPSLVTALPASSPAPLPPSAPPVTVPTEVAIAPSVAPKAPPPVFEVPLPTEKPASALSEPAPVVTPPVAAAQPDPSAPSALPATLVTAPASTVPVVSAEAGPAVTAQASTVPTPGFGGEPVAESVEETAPSPTTMIAMASPPSIPPGQPIANAPVESTVVADSAATPAEPVPAAAGLSSIIASLTPEAESAAGPLPTDRELRALRLAAKKKADAEATAKTDAEAKRAAAEKEKADAAAKAKASPSRVWVQIATGSNKSGLAGTVRSVREKAPKALGSLAGWYAPVRATNRILVGPMKSAADARSLVTALAKDGVQANSWSSAAGEEVFRIGK